MSAVGNIPLSHSLSLKVSETMFRLLLVFLCVAFSAQDLINHKSCDSTTTYAENVNVYVSGCSKEDTSCTLYKGQSYDVRIEFDCMKNFTGSNLFKVYGMFDNGMKVPYGRSKNACSDAKLMDGSGTCESMGGFLEGHRYCHESKFDVSRRYPEVKVTTIFVIMDRRSKMHMMCAEVPVEIQGNPDDDD